MNHNINETHFLYNMQLEKNWLITASCPEYWESRDTIIHHAI